MPTALNSIALFFVAAFFEIAGCFAFWSWLRSGRHPGWTILGVISLILFATALTRIETPFAGRAYAAYGGIYIVASLLWMWQVEKNRPDFWDVAGAVVCLIGAMIVLFGKRTTERSRCRLTWNSSKCTSLFAGHGDEDRFDNSQRSRRITSLAASQQTSLNAESISSTGRRLPRHREPPSPNLSLVCQ